LVHTSRKRNCCQAPIPAYPCGCMIGSHASPVLSYPLQRTYTQSSSPCHHQPGCENPNKFQQSVQESIALNHLSAA
jgi:hypothetical protein